MSKFDKSILLVGNGALISKSLLENLMKKSSFILAVDGGANLLKKNNSQPNAIIGDFDSVQKSDFSEWQNTNWISAKNQNKNDLEKALDWAIEHNFSTIHLVSFLGKRADQAFATFSICRKFCTNLDIQIHTDFEQIFVVSKSQNIATKRDQIISILPLSMSATVTANELEYPLNNTTLFAGSQGVSNISISKNVFIQVHSGSVLVFLNK